MKIYIVTYGPKSETQNVRETVELFDLQGFWPLLLNSVLHGHVFTATVNEIKALTMTRTHLLDQVSL